MRTRRLAIADSVQLDVAVERLGTVFSPDGSLAEAEGVLNPAFTRARDGGALLYPRAVQHGNVSRIERVTLRERDGTYDAKRLGFALEPEAPYELRPQPGYGCEDPRVTFVPALDEYLMAYTAFGPEGPRIAIARSKDGYDWERLGLVHFEHPGATVGDDKDAAFFPEPVISPEGVPSIAFYHRPMLHISTVNGAAAIPLIARMPYADRESIRIAYVPLDAVMRDRRALLRVGESVLVLSPEKRWGSIRIGAGTPPVRIAEGWMSLYHAVDLVVDDTRRPRFRYCAGIVVHDAEQPHRVLYRSPEPVLVPEEQSERHGIVDNVVFPTGIDARADLGARTFDVFYGMADYSCGAVRITLT
jgi:beta-1,2-mannobiose phosphorylase / 1,2-beta-oligomannan phosphorylase